MHVDRLWSGGIESDHVLLDIADSGDGALKNLLDELPLLRLHDLVVAVLQLSVDLYILYVQGRQVLEDLIRRPVGDVGLTFLILFSGQMLDLYLFLKIVHGISQLHVISDVTHNGCFKL